MWAANVTKVPTSSSDIAKPRSNECPSHFPNSEIDPRWANQINLQKNT